MNKVLIIRQNIYDNPYLVNCIKLTNEEVVDISTPECITINQINDNGIADCDFSNHHLTTFDTIFFINTPAKYKNPYAPSRDEIYIQQELEHALLAALYVGKVSDVVNAAIVFSFRRYLFQPNYQINALAKIGWKYPKATFNYDIGEAKSSKVIAPNPDVASRYYLFVTKRKEYVFSVGQIDPIKDKEKIPKELIGLTRKHLKINKTDWCVILYSSHDDGIYAHGLSYTLPEVLSNNMDISKVLNSIL